MSNKKWLFLYFLTVLCTFLLCVPAWVFNQFGSMEFEQILFILVTDSNGANTDIVGNFILYLINYLVISSLLFFAVYFIFSFRYTIKIRINKSIKQFRIHTDLSKKGIALITVISLILSIGNIIYRLNVIDYFQNRLATNALYEDYYVAVADTDITFPETKQNLIYIYLESMQSSFNSASIDGEIVNLIPNLQQIAEENISFSSTNELGGAYTGPNLSWTVASLVGQTSGIPLSVPVSGNDYGTNGTFLPGVDTLGEILESEGYSNYFLLGSSSLFGGRKAYYETHGDYEILDYDYRIENGDLSSDYFVFWGYEDSKLFDYAKELLLDISENDEPFNVTMLTVDSHFMDGYTDETCESPYSIAYANAIACSDVLISSFIRWVQAQPFYENTTIILSADHITMNNQFRELLTDTTSSSLYNVIINSPKTAVSTTERDFMVIDFYPTTLSALGVTIEGDRLGLGTDLFSASPTLYEIFEDEFITMLSAQSNYYDTIFFRNKE